MKKYRELLSLLVSLFVCSQVTVDPVLGAHVVLAGDSITVGDSSIGVDGYAPSFQSAFGGMTTVVGKGGLDASGFTGIDPSDSGNRTYPVIATDADPDFIVFMLGINSAMRGVNIESNYDEHRKRIGTGSSNVIFDEFDTLGSNVEVIVLSILPVDQTVAGVVAGTNSRVNGVGAVLEDDVDFGYNPFYEAEVQRRNSEVGGPTFRYVDLTDPSQTSMVFNNSFLLSADGLHLNSAGNTWLANEVLLQVTAVPEPSAVMAIGLLGLFAIVCRRRSFPSAAG